MEIGAGAIFVGAHAGAVRPFPCWLGKPKPRLAPAACTIVVAALKHRRPPLDFSASGGERRVGGVELGLWWQRVHASNYIVFVCVTGCELGLGAHVDDIFVLALWPIQK